MIIALDMIGKSEHDRKKEQANERAQEKDGRQIQRNKWRD